MKPTDYKAKRNYLIDEAYRLASIGEKYLYEFTLGKVGKLDREYTEQCNKCFKYEEGTE